MRIRFKAHKSSFNIYINTTFVQLYVMFTQICKNNKYATKKKINHFIYTIQNDKC